MDTRREFLKKAALLSGFAGFSGILPASIQKALAIDPAPGSTWLDAEHVVILIQENRSFDHVYGCLQGVRGFNDPRAITLANGHPVWLQTNAAGETYAPFRLDIKETNATWMGSLPHTWGDMTEARNQGRHDRWLDAKPSSHAEYARMPLTLGYYNREDLPFYYALADAFTVFDQNFCSSLTGTTPNRLYLWSGTLREHPSPESRAHVWNSDAAYGSPVRWTTFPERLEANGIPWKVYQNELGIDTGLTSEEHEWLTNFTDNPLEWFEQFQVNFLPSHFAHLQNLPRTLPAEIEALEKRLASPEEPDAKRLKKKLTKLRARLKAAEEGSLKWSRENFDKLSQREKALHSNAFCTNVNDPDYRQLTTLEYRDGDAVREVRVPKGDIFHQFRADVKAGALPAVSWLVAPGSFSDHPGEPWYGAWYVSEAMDILTGNPEVWKKTIFILAYDENDGYFDHAPPFVPPHPHKPGTGVASKGLNLGAEHVEAGPGEKSKFVRDCGGSPIGLGFRVPMVIASPWSRGGRVCSQVGDHTSILRFLETLFTHKTGREITEPNITAWRRTVCGDLTAAFQPYHGEKIQLPSFLARDASIEEIHRARFKGLPTGFKSLSAGEIAQIGESPRTSPLLPRQEPGVRQACALPYQLYLEGKLSADKSRFDLSFEAGNEVFKAKSAGAPFTVYTLAKYRPLPDSAAFADQTNRAYAVAAGDRVSDSWALGQFEDGTYHLAAHGPNGFFREFSGDADDPLLEVRCEYERLAFAPSTLSGNVELNLANPDPKRARTVTIQDHSYKTGTRSKTLPAGCKASVVLDLDSSHGWYDFTVRVAGFERFAIRYAGHVETGKTSRTDPAMGYPV